MKCCPKARRRAAVSVHGLERRLLMSAAFDLTGLTDLRADPTFPGIDGSDVAVAILDTGVYADHPALRSNVIAYYNAVSSQVPASIGPSSAGLARDAVGHGTHVAGTVAAQDPEVGVAPAAKVVSVKVIADPGEPQAGGDPLLRGLQFVERFAEALNIKVVNMSLGMTTTAGGVNLNAAPDPDGRARAIDALEEMGVTVVSAAGNSYANDPVPGASMPAVYSTVSVASTWATGGGGHDFAGIGMGSPYDRYAPFETSAAPDRFAASSQRSTLPNQVAAPGVDVYSTWNGAGGFGGPLLYNTLSGTSMAAPLVSGVVALMQDAAMTFGGRYLTDVDQVLEILRDTADLVTDVDVDDNGRYAVSSGGVLDPTPLELPETGETFARVNVLNALRRVRSIVSGNGGGGDLDSSAGNATSLPALSGGAAITRRGRIGTDGGTAVGPSDVDVFRVTIASPGDLTVLLSPPTGGELFTPVLRLFNSSGFQVARADGTAGAYPVLGAGGGGNPGGEPLPPGIYYVGVSSLANTAYSVADGSGAVGGLSQGDYTLTVALNNPDENGVAPGAQAVDLTLPDTLAFASVASSLSSGVIGADPAAAGTPGSPQALVTGGDVDMYRVVAPDDGSVEARTLSVQLPGGPVVDTYVRVFDADFAEVGANDNISPQNLDSRVSVPVQAGRTYYVGVTNFANRDFSPLNPYGRVPNSTIEQEPYGLYLAFSSGDADGTAVKAVARAVGEAVAGAVGTDGGAAVGAGGGSKDVDFSRFAAPADGLLDLAVAGSGDFESVLALWAYDPGQHTVVKLGEAAGAAPRLVRPVTAGQAVYASVTGRGNQEFNWFATASGPGGQTGSYTLTSSLRPPTDLPALSDGAAQGRAPVALAAGVPLVASLGSDGPLLLDADVDVYAFVPAATGRYDVRTDTSAEGSADTVLRVFDAAGNPVALNDNATARTNASALRVTLTAGQTYYVGVSGAGAGAAVYDVGSGAGAAAGSRGGYGLVVAPSAAGAPAVSVADAAPVAESFRAGSAATFTIALDAPAASAVTVAYTTADGSAAAGADYTPAAGTVTFAPGETVKTVTVQVAGDALAEGDEAFALDVAVVDGAEAAVADERGSVTVHNQAVQPIGFNAALRATFTDADGGRVVVSLRGPGSGEVLLLGNAPSDAAAIALTGTTAASTLTVTGDTSVGAVTVGGALRGLTGKALDLAGNLAVAGSLAQLRIRNVLGGAINIGPGAPLAGTLGAVADASLTAAGGIRSLRVARWGDSDGANDFVNAPSIASLQSLGDFGADVSAGALGRLVVGGALLGADVRAAGKIGSVRLGGAAGSRVFAGLRADVNTLPNGADDFADPSAAIASFSVTGRAGTFGNTLVAAPAVGRVVLGTVRTDNGGTPFGVAATVVQSVAVPSFRGSRLPKGERADGDFRLRVL